MSFFIYQKFWFFFMLLMGTLMVISSNSWLNAWLGLEINLMSFISFIIKKNSSSNEASILYFIFQVFASLIFLFAIIMFLNFSNLLFFFDFYFYIILLSLLMKIGSVPFHFWMPMIMENLNWMNNLLLMTWQKIAPMILIFYILQTKLLIIFIIFSVILSSLSGLNQTSIRLLMAYSSINQISWMMMSLMINEIMWKMYLLFYFIIMFMLIILFNKFNLFFLNQLFSMNFKNVMIKNILFMNLLSLGGLPPFLGFFPKFLIIKEMLILNLNYLMILMISFSLLILYFYLRIMYFSFLFNNFMFKNIFFNKNFNNKIFIFNMFLNNFLLMLLMILYF